MANDMKMRARLQGEGDSIHFRCVRPHSWRNPTDEPARAVWLVVRAS